MGRGGTYPDLAMTMGISLLPCGNKVPSLVVKSSGNLNVDGMKRILHKNMFACVNMVVTKDIYDLNERNFIYNGTGDKAGGHSLVCCGYDDESKMFIMQNHWGKTWGLKGFFLCPFSVWSRQSNLTCWYERAGVSLVETQKPNKTSRKKQVEATETVPDVVEPTKVEPTEIEPTKVEPTEIEPIKIEVSTKTEPPKEQVAPCC